jgi:hypothetical protein
MSTNTIPSEVQAQSDVTLEAGRPVQDNTYEEYGIETLPVLSDGEDTGRRFIIKDGKFLSAVSSQYNVLPNQRALEVGDALADELGLVPFDEFGGDWYVEMNDHAITDREGRRLHAMYAWDENVVDGDDMNYGVILHNSIDRSLGFSVGLFTFRHACSNMVWIGAGQAQEGMDFDDRNVVNSYYHQHTDGLETETNELLELAKKTVDLIPEVHETYEEWASRDGIRFSDIRGLRDRLPHKDLPSWVQKALDKVEVEEDDEPDDVVRKEDEALMDEMPVGESKWDVYNDVTESIWHSSTSDQTKQTKNRDLHRVMNPV